MTVDYCSTFLFIILDWYRVSVSHASVFSLFYALHIKLLIYFRFFARFSFIKIINTYDTAFCIE
jgi:hypothetical protein